MCKGLAPLSPPDLSVYGKDYGLYIEHYKMYEKLYRQANKAAVLNEPAAPDAFHEAFQKTVRQVNQVFRPKTVKFEGDVQPEGSQQVSLVDHDDGATIDVPVLPERPSIGEPVARFLAEKQNVIGSKVSVPRNDLPLDGVLVKKKHGERIIDHGEGVTTKFPRPGSPSNYSAQELLGSYLTPRAFLRMRDQGFIPADQASVDVMKSHIQKYRQEHNISGPVDFGYGQ